MDEDGFVVVRHSKKGKNKFNAKKNQSIIKRNIELNTEDGYEREQVNEKEILEKLKQLVDQFWDSEFFKNFIRDVLIPHGLVLPSENNSKRPEGPHVSSNRISKVICLGLGKFTSSKQAEYQLVFLKCLVKVLDLKQSLDSVSIFDPVHSDSEVNILTDLGFQCHPKSNNLEGKYHLEDQSGKETLFYLPHCPKQLTNNILWANWNPKFLGSTESKVSEKRSLHGLHILANSFDRITSTLPDRILRQSAEYILLASKFVFETKVENCFKFTDIFNDTSLHSFPCDQLPSIDDPVWKIAIEKGEPAYKEDNEFISK